MNIKTRFAPSPTGSMHIGSVRTALYSWLFARHYDGEFILRIENTDYNRCNYSFVKDIIDNLNWLGLTWDRVPFFQTDNLKQYNLIIKNMLLNKVAYKCYCSLERLQKLRNYQMSKGIKFRYDNKCRDVKYYTKFNQPYVVRFKNPEFGIVSFNDKIRGLINFKNTELDDLVIMRSNGIPTYNFCSVIDDSNMQITHVIRGEEHINNTPRQINMLNSLEKSIPIYAHLPIILDSNGKKMSKRNNTLMNNLFDYRKSGYLPESILNYLLRLGWSYKNKEIFSIDEMKNLFNLKSVNKSSCFFDIKKLQWLNNYYINKLPRNYIICNLKKQFDNDELNHFNNFNLSNCVEVFSQRCQTLKQLSDYCRLIYNNIDNFKSNLSRKYLKIDFINCLTDVYNKLYLLDVWIKDDISVLIKKMSLNYKNNLSFFYMSLRVALINNITPISLISLLYAIGRKHSLQRIKKAIFYIYKKYSKHIF
ncbi:glutamate--tRNA ligase [Buchnera aphidicola (Neophyllaphis varicolor)]|uniref:glutamate--tRNA ligase n=1 Tax=Buchnera aphidicola TaxID=9 RepID=UPI0031B89E00